MKKYCLNLFVIICLFILPACSTNTTTIQNCQITSDDIDYMKMSWSRIEPKLKKYIENDKELSERDKLSLKNHVKSITEILTK